jgi:hypothetical protein
MLSPSARRPRHGFLKVSAGWDQPLNEARPQANSSICWIVQAQIKRGDFKRVGYKMDDEGMPL